MDCPPFSEILMVGQNVRSGGERQRGLATLIFETTFECSVFGRFGRCSGFFVEKNELALRLWQSANSFRFIK